MGPCNSVTNDSCGVHWCQMEKYSLLIYSAIFISRIKNIKSLINFDKYRPVVRSGQNMFKVKHFTLAAFVTKYYLQELIIICLLIQISYMFIKKWI